MRSRYFFGRAKTTYAPATCVGSVESLSETAGPLPCAAQTAMYSRPPSSNTAGTPSAAAGRVGFPNHLAGVFIPRAQLLVVGRGEDQSAGGDHRSSALRDHAGIGMALRRERRHAAIRNLPFDRSGVEIVRRHLEPRRRKRRKTRALRSEIDVRTGVVSERAIDRNFAPAAEAEARPFPSPSRCWCPALPRLADRPEALKSASWARLGKRCTACP